MREPTTVQANKQFLLELAPEHFKQMWVCEDGRNNPAKWAGGFAPGRVEELNTDEACYMSAALLKPGATERNNAAFDGGWLIVLDDVGEKLNQIFADSFAPEPTYKIETSHGNYQWGYRIEPIETDPRRWHGFYELLRKSKFAAAGDNSGLCAYKRLPFGKASKPEKKGFVTRLTEWSPDRTYTLDGLAVELGFSLDDESLANIRAPHMGDITAEPMSQALLTEAVTAIPNDEYFAAHDPWVRLCHSIYGASAGSSWGRTLWLDWCDKIEQGEPEKPAYTWDTLKPGNVRSGAGYIRKQLDRIGEYALLSEAKGEAADFERETGFTDEDNPVGDGPTASKNMSVKLLRASDVEMEAIHWIWNGYLAQGKMHLLAGASTAGKTTLAVRLAATVSTGNRWPDGTRAERGNVLIWSGEDDIRDTLVPRLEAAGADLNNVYMIDGMDERGKHRSFDPSKDMPVLASRVKEIGGANLIVIDSIISAIAGDAHKANEVRRGLQPVVDLAARYRMAVLGITHMTKGSQGKLAQDRIMGSQAFGALSRINMFAAAEYDENGHAIARTFVRGYSNIGPSGGGFNYEIEETEIKTKHGEIIKPTRAIFGEAVSGSADSILARAEGAQAEAGRPPEQRNVAVDLLRRLLADGPVPSEDIKRAAASNLITRSTLNRAKEELHIVAFQQRRTWFWRLPMGDETLETDVF